MTNTFKRRIYRYCVASAISFLGAFLLYDLGDIGIATDRLLFPCVVLWIVGILLGFKDADTWSGWDNDTSEETIVSRYRSIAYPIYFFKVYAIDNLSVYYIFI